MYQNDLVDTSLDAELAGRAKNGASRTQYKRKANCVVGEVLLEQLIAKLCTQAQVTQLMIWQKACYRRGGHSSADP
jgi:hypothetical protein